MSFKKYSLGAAIVAAALSPAFVNTGPQADAPQADELEIIRVGADSSQPTPDELEIIRNRKG